VSSPAVVFDGNDHTDQTENAPYPARFTSVYARTKKEAEDRVNAARETMKIVILRPKAVFGPGDTSLLPRLLAAAERNRLPQIGDGTNRVDLTYVENVVHALLLAKDAPAAIGRTYTITNGESPRLWEIVRHVLTELGVSANLRRVSLPAALSVAAMMETAAHVTGKEPLLTRYSVRILARTQTYDISAAERDLGYTPVVSLSEGIERTVAAFAEKAHGTASVC
jgi:2-alkyl-3-oxoalkanoate reductase